MEHYQIVIDTNVLVAGFKSQLGASFRLLQLIGRRAFTVHISIPLFYEYEEQLYLHTSVNSDDIDTFLAFLFQHAEKHNVYFLLRPLTKNTDDDMVGEIAFAARADYIVSYNKADLKPIEQRYAIPIITAKEFLEILGEIS